MRHRAINQVLLSKQKREEPWKEESVAVKHSVQL